MVTQDIVEAPEEIWQYHKCVALTIGIFFVNGVPYFVTLSLQICFVCDTFE